jgi:hypothetical protein
MFSHLLRELFRHYLLKMFMHDGASARTHRGCGRVPVLMNMLENRKTESNDALVWIARKLHIYGRMNCTEHIVDTAEEQLILVAKVHVESGAAYVGAIKNLLHDNFVVRLFADERSEGLVQQIHRLLNAPILRPLFAHYPLSLMNQT